MSGDDTSDPTAVDRPGADKRTSGAHDSLTTPASGRLVANRYRLLSLLGRGGMGEVYVARDEMMARDVAVKRMLDAAPSDDAVERFLREARVQGRLEHPAIPPVYELARDVDGRPFFAMKRLDGTPLSKILQGLRAGDATIKAAYPLQRLLRAFVEICNAVAVAHDRGVIHRDIKPSNMMLGDRGEVYLLDWGVAKVIGLRELVSMREIPLLGGKLPGPVPEMSNPGIVIGTAGYMAPEQGAGDAVDHRADIYALGCVLFEILAGLPYKSRSERTVDDTVAPELASLCEQATALSPEHRLASAGDMAATVQRYLDGNRDLALRREIARKHLMAAKAALHQGDLRSSLVAYAAERDPRAAMREAGRALALDPTLTDAADLVGRLMLEPPKDVPPDVERAIHTETLEQARKQAVIGMIGYVGYLIFAAALLAFGIGDTRYAWAMLALATGSFVFSALGMRHADHLPRLILVVVLNAILIGLIARMFSPVLCAPTAAAVTLMAVVSNPLLYSKRWIVASTGALTIGMLAPMLGERMGWLPSTFAVDHGVLTIIAPSLGSGRYASLGLAVFSVTVVALVAVMGRVRARSEDLARRKLHLQAWWLRQLFEIPPATA
jgi:eukaryotic-like serine/threonine-protein kinase